MKSAQENINFCAELVDSSKGLHAGFHLGEGGGGAGEAPPPPPPPPYTWFVRKKKTA